MVEADGEGALAALAQEAREVVTIDQESLALSQNILLFVSKADAMKGMGDSGGACDEYAALLLWLEEQELQLTPHYAFCLDAKAEILMGMGDVQGAIHHLTLAEESLDRICRDDGHCALVTSLLRQVRKGLVL